MTWAYANGVAPASGFPRARYCAIAVSSEIIPPLLVSKYGVEREGCLAASSLFFKSSGPRVSTFKLEPVNPATIYTRDS